MDRRDFLTSSLAASAGTALSRADEPPKNKALIAITFDLEMSANFPKWDDTHWNYEKGNLNDETKKYAVGACKRVKVAGGVLHCFAVGRVFEQENVDWLREIAKTGHPIGNHTYDHVYVKAKKPEEIQFRFRRSPWLIDGQKVSQVIAENIRLTTAALKTRVGVDAAGFRTPGGFANGLQDAPEVRKMLIDQGFTWVSSKYPAHTPAKPGEEPTEDLLANIVKVQEAAQPFAYADGLIEVPMSPISDIGAFRTGRWKLDWFLKAIKRAVEWAIEKRAVFDFLGHPSCLYVVDPEFKTIDMICELVKKAGDKAALVGLDAIAARMRAKKD
jgi:peptidoglycan/xylan/chitin deacetylase (PgdA/CDA1 family)